MKKLSDTEFEIMQILWSCDEALTSNQILEMFKERRNWKLASVMTLLSRMTEKGFVNCDRSTRTNYYEPIISEREYKASVSESLLGKMYNNSAKDFIACLYQGKKLSSKDIKEIREYLNALGDKMA